MSHIAGFVPGMLLAALAAIVIGYLSGRVLARLSGVSRATAFFSSVPGGAMEMACVGERFGALIDRVAIAQTLRILIVVSIIPWAYTALGLHGSDRLIVTTAEFRLTGLAALLAATWVGGVLLRWLRVPNAWMLGALVVSIPLTAFQVELSGMPRPVSNLGQMLIGCALATRFGSEVFRSAPRYLASVAISMLVAIALSAAFGAALAWLLSVNPASLILATAPGGVAEMCITAEALQLGVPLVTAFHVTRVLILVTAAAPLFAVLSRQAGTK